MRFAVHAVIIDLVFAFGRCGFEHDSVASSRSLHKEMPCFMALSWSLQEGFLQMPTGAAFADGLHAGSVAYSLCLWRLGQARRGWPWKLFHVCLRSCLVARLCVAPASYDGICSPAMDFQSYSLEDKMQFSSMCGVEW